MNLLRKLEKRKPLFSILQCLSESYGSSYGRIYLVGGAVRDIINDADRINDLDISITFGYPLEYAQNIDCWGLKKHIKGERIYNTAKLRIDFQDNEFCIDINHTRREKYIYPGSLPEIEWVDSLFFDVSRRDFSLNAIAMSLNKDSFGEVLDYHNGIADLKDKRVRVLHDDSFADDPIRIFRLIRYMKRLGLEIEKNTKVLFERAIDNDYNSWVSYDRIFDELVKGLSEDYSHLYFKDFNRYGIFKNEYFNDCNLERFETGGNSILKQFDGCVDPLLLKILLLKSPIFLKFNMPKGYKACLRNYIKKSKEWENAISSTSTDLGLYKIASSIPNEALVAIAFSCDPDKKAYHLIKHYFSSLKGLKTNLRGRDLLLMGYKQGKQISVALEEILYGKIQGDIEDSIEAEIKFIEKKLGRNV